MPEIEIRESRPEDLAALEALYPAAFPDEDLLPVVRALLASEPGILSPGILSLVASVDDELTGHVLFTPCGLSGSPARLAMLAPLAVAPQWQRRGIGKALIRDGLDRLEQAGVAHVYVLGDPAYYRHSGFRPETAIAPPYPLPEEWRGAWQSVSLGGAPKPPAGTLTVMEVWMQPALWGP
ncbi:MAG: N-acetyltransferase [Hoeflea sp.]|uniref:GNAT family N-acetyltransferase n=1 Tax=Hoeflea sp. TaxID=1940281 RepID=UPI00273004B9|nr:N-acetyltransferase [Hoeflea sp.]MDP2118973.1 N-acetyltransferase [Hoeflea sp.]